MMSKAAPIEPPPAAVVNTVIVDPPAAETPRMRAATADDIEQIEQLTLEDFDIDFDKVTLPPKAAGELFSKEELDIAVDGFLAALRER